MDTSNQLTNPESSSKQENTETNGVQYYNNPEFIKSVFQNFAKTTSSNSSSNPDADGERQKTPKPSNFSSEPSQTQPGPSQGQPNQTLTNNQIGGGFSSYPQKTNGAPPVNSSVSNGSMQPQQSPTMNNMMMQNMQNNMMSMMYSGANPYMFNSMMYNYQQAQNFKGGSDTNTNANGVNPSGYNQTTSNGVVAKTSNENSNDKDRERDNYNYRNRDRERERDRGDRDRDRERDRDRNRDRERERERDKDKYEYKRENRDEEKDKSWTKDNNDWAYRNGKGGIRTFLNNENENLFREHLEQMKKKQAFDFNNLKTLELLVFYQNKEVEVDKHIENFKDLKSINPKLLKNLDRMQFDQMTPIQKYVTPFILEGHDVMGCSATGSGKTIAFLLPIAQKMLSEGPPDDSNVKRGASAPVALILIPTRELAEQIYVQARKLLHETGLSVVKVYGGVPHDTQIKDFRFGCDILVSTPGRLLDFLKSGMVTLSQVKYFIIDEADRILDMGFEPQLNSITFENDLCEKRKRLNLFFSATFTPEVRTIARKFMNEYYFITKSKDEENHVNENIQQVIYQAEEGEKLVKLHNVLQTIHGSVIIFVETKRGVDQLGYQLIKAKYNVIAIHGDKTQVKRNEAIRKFSEGTVPILIATDVASRGLDFPSVSYVFNYDMPTNIDDYIHRIGRTGRCGNKGVAISFINEKNKPIIKDLYLILEKYKQEIPGWFYSLYKRFKDEKIESNMMRQRGRQNGFFKNNNNSFNSGYQGGFGRQPSGNQNPYQRNFNSGFGGNMGFGQGQGVGGNQMPYGSSAGAYMNSAGGYSVNASSYNSSYGNTNSFKSGRDYAANSGRDSDKIGDRGFKSRGERSRSKEGRKRSRSRERDRSRDVKRSRSGSGSRNKRRDRSRSRDKSPKDRRRSSSNSRDRNKSHKYSSYSSKQQSISNFDRR